jgi:hypothetical protein
VNILNCVQNEDGSLDFDFHVDGDEAAFLMDFAIKSLIHNGILRVTEDPEQQLDLFPETEGGIQ